MADNSLEIKIGADVSSLQAQMAVAQANLRETQASVKTLAKGFVDASDDIKASLAPALEKAVAASSEAKASIAALSAEMKLAAEESKTGLTASITKMGESIEAANAKIGAVTGIISKLSEFALVGLGIDKAAEAINGVAETGEKLSKLSEVTGISTEQLSALRVIAIQTGTDFDSFGGDLTKLSRKISESIVNPTGTAAQAFRAMGVSVTDAAGNVRPMSDVIEELAGKLASYEGGANKAALESAIFGRSGTDLDAMLRKLADEGMARAITQSKNLGQSWSNEQAKAAVEFEDNVKTLELGLEGLAASILKDVIPSLTELANSWRAAIDPTPLDHAKDELRDLQAQATLLKSMVEHPWVGMLHGMSAGEATDELERVGELIKKKQAEINGDTGPKPGPKPDSVPAPVLAKPPKEVTGMAELEDQLHQELLAGKGKYGKEAEAFELDFWEKQNKTAVAGTAEAAAITGRLYALKNEQFKQGEAAAKTASGQEVGIWQAGLEKHLSDEGIFGDKAKTAELAFWQQKQSTATVGSAQYKEIIAKVYALQSELDAKRVEEAKKTAAAEVDNVTRVATAKIDTLQGEQSRLQGEVTLGKITASQKAAMEIDLANQIYAIELDTANRKAALYVGDKDKYAQALNEKAVLESQHTQRTLTLTQQAALATQQAWTRAFAPIGTAFSTSINGIISGTETLKQAEQKAAQSIVLSFIDSEEKKLQAALITDIQTLASKVRTDTAITASTVASGQAQVASKAATTAQGSSISLMAGAKEIAADAYKAAAGAYNAVVGIPFIGPALAPAAAAVAYAGVMAFDVISARGGMGDVPYDDMPALLHKNEMVLPSGIAGPLRDALSGGQGVGGALGTGGGDVHIHGPMMAANMSAHGMGAGDFAHQVMSTLNDHVQNANFAKYKALQRAFRR